MNEQDPVTETISPKDKKRLLKKADKLSSFDTFKLNC